MIFTSFDFLVFFIFVFYSYWFLNLKYQNYLLLAASYFFYGYWDYRFLALLFFSSILDYTFGRAIYNSKKEKDKRRFLVLSLVINLTVLCFFKYFNFFTDSTVDLLNLLNIKASWSALNIILPIGISFYTFQSMSYSIDIYRNKLKPSNNLLNFLTYLSFFPQLVAGPIERAGSILPQIVTKRTLTWEKLSSGILLIAFGFFKKAAIADNLAYIIDPVFSNPANHHSLLIVLSVILFTIQMYCDFSGYTDIARGVARCFGFELSINFKRPYFARNPIDFWARWHISLSLWFKDYLYYPIALHFVRKSQGVFSQYKAHFVSMFLIGLWHGAAYTFLVYGSFWGVAIIGYSIVNKKFKKPPLLVAILGNYLIVCCGFYIYRVENLSDIKYLYLNLVPNLELSNVLFYEANIKHLLLLGFAVTFLFIIDLYEEYQEEKGKLLIYERSQKINIFSIIVLFLITMVYRSPNYEAFIYFQF